MRELIERELEESRSVLSAFISDPKNIADIEAGAKLMIDAIQGGHKIISCGNGGSALRSGANRALPGQAARPARGLDL
jgi:D-sedoheptulose 7-phosphate isomerase